MRHSRNQRVAAFLLAGVLAATPLLAQRQPTPGPGGSRPRGTRPDPLAPGSLGRCLAIVDLSDSQKVEIGRAVEASQPALRALNEQLRAAHESFNNAIGGPNPEACSVGAALLRIKTAEAAIQSEMESLQRRIEALLTGEQRMKFTGCLEGLGRPDEPRR